MSRIGVQSKEEALSIAKRTKDSPYVILKGLFTHFANADSEDPSYTYLQFERFHFSHNLFRTTSNYDTTQTLL